MTGFTVPQRDKLLWLATDLDNTLAEPLWTPDNPTAEIGAPIRRNVAKLREAARAGWKPVIHSSRGWDAYEAVEAWLNVNDVPFSRIVLGKLLAAAYIDDRAINANESSWIPSHHGIVR